MPSEKVLMRVACALLVAILLTVVIWAVSGRHPTAAPDEARLAVLLPRTGYAGIPLEGRVDVAADSGAVAISGPLAEELTMSPEHQITWAQPKVGDHRFTFELRDGEQVLATADWEVEIVPPPQAPADPVQLSLRVPEGIEAQGLRVVLPAGGGTHTLTLAAHQGNQAVGEHQLIVVVPEPEPAKPVQEPRQSRAEPSDASHEKPVAEPQPRLLEPRTWQQALTALPAATPPPENRATTAITRKSESGLTLEGRANEGSRALSRAMLSTHLQNVDYRYDFAEDPAIAADEFRLLVALGATKGGENSELAVQATESGQAIVKELGSHVLPTEIWDLVVRTSLQAAGSRPLTRGDVHWRLRRHPDIENRVMVQVLADDLHYR